MADLVARAKNILLQPRSEWQVIAAEQTSPAELFKGYIMPLAAIGPVASAIGITVFGLHLPTGGTLRLAPGDAILQAAVSYIIGLVGVVVLALIINALAPGFSGEKNADRALKTAAYSSTAAWLAGIFSLVPAFGMLGLLGLYSIYLLYLGLPALMKIPPEKALGCTVLVVLISLAVFFVLGMVGGILLPRPPLPGLEP
jgi:hypothetical protein